MSTPPTSATGSSSRSTGSTGRSSTLSSVTNAVRLLKAFTASRQEWGVTELAERLDLGKSTTHRLLATLLDEGMVQQDPETGRYRLGLAVFDLASAVKTFSLHEAVMPPMTELRNRSGETVQVGVLDGTDVVYIERLDSPNTLRLFLEVGRRNAVYCTGSGKALLAFAPRSVVDRVLKSISLEPRTEHTITDPVRLRAELDEARRNGYAANRQESELGVVSFAAPIRGMSGSVVAAISVAGPAERLVPAERQFVHATREAAAEASRRLGYRGQDAA